MRPTYHKTAKDHFPENYVLPNSTTKLTLPASKNSMEQVINLVRRLKVHIVNFSRVNNFKNTHPE